MDNSVPTAGTSRGSPNVLPDATIDRLFRRLAAMYGRAWLEMWVGVPLAEVRAEWGRSLSSVTVEQMRLAFDHLERKGVKFPPNLPEFKSLCDQFRRAGPHALALVDGRRDPPPGGFASLKSVLGKTTLGVK
jgi:hypothetical protein